MPEGLFGLKARLRVSVGEVEVWACTISQVRQPGAETDGEPFSEVKGFEKDQLCPLDGRVDWVDNANFGLLLLCHRTSPPR